jgi:Sec-independent protein translocase protein TatA
VAAREGQVLSTLITALCATIAILELAAWMLLQAVAARLGVRVWVIYACLCCRFQAAFDCHFIQHDGAVLVAVMKEWLLLLVVVVVVVMPCRQSAMKGALAKHILEKQLATGDVQDEAKRYELLLSQAGELHQLQLDAVGVEQQAMPLAVWV